MEIVDCQGHLVDGGRNDGKFVCNRFLDHMKEIYPENKLSYIVMFDGYLNVQLGGNVLKVNFAKLTVIFGVEHTVSLFFNDVSKAPIVRQIISYQKVIYNSFDSDIYHQSHSILKPKYQEFCNRNIGILLVMILVWLGISWKCTKNLRM